MIHDYDTYIHTLQYRVSELHATRRDGDGQENTQSVNHSLSQWRGSLETMQQNKSNVIVMSSASGVDLANRSPCFIRSKL